jgi:proline iminopeptidase
MEISVRGVRLWFDVEGAALVPAPGGMRVRPTIVLLHGGPGSYDHTYFRPDFDRLARHAQVVFLDLRGHGRSERGDPERWRIEACADDVRSFADALGLDHPIVLGHSLGGFVAQSYAVRHPDHPRALVLSSTSGRFDVARIVAGMERAGGAPAAEIAGRFYAGDLTDVEGFRTRVRPLFGPWVPGDEERSRIVVNEALLAPGLARMREFDILADLARVRCPTLVVTGDLDPVTQVADASEIVDAIPAGLARMEVIPGAGHFAWKDAPERYWPTLERFLSTL